MMQWILERFRRAGVETDHGPNVSAGPNSADPHYEPTSSRSRSIGVGDVVLIDLWATEKPGRPYADQTWMATVGPPSPRVVEVWTAVCDARDAAIELVQSSSARQIAIPGAAADDAARRVITGGSLKCQMRSPDAEGATSPGTRWEPASCTDRE